MKDMRSWRLIRGLQVAGLFLGGFMLPFAPAWADEPELLPEAAELDIAPLETPSPETPTPAEPIENADSEHELYQNDYLGTPQTFRRGIPIYQQIRPRWGFQVSASAKPVQSYQGPIADQSFQNRTLILQTEYQPENLQHLGIFGVGPTLFLAIPFPGPTRLSLYGLGLQLRYQARFVREQVLVPFVGLEAQYLRYYLKNPDRRGSVLGKGPFVGLNLLLNTFEQEGAASFYSNFGVVRSYLVGELRVLSGSDANVTLTGSAIYVGLRFEY